MRQMKDSWENFWTKSYKNDSNVGSWSKKRIISKLEPYLIANKQVLDAGCGSGFFSGLFCHRGMAVTALDYSDAALALAMQATDGRARIVKADLLAPDFAVGIEQHFDLIFSDGLFEHFSSAEQDQIIKNLVSVLVPGGKLVTFVPNTFSPWQIIRPFMMPGITETPFTFNKLLDLNQRNGLTVIAAGGVNVLPFRFSPEGRAAKYFGMLLYTISTRRQ